MDIAVVLAWFRELLSGGIWDGWSSNANNWIFPIIIQMITWQRLGIYTIICLKSVIVRKLQVAILARSPREMSQTDHIGWQHILSRVRVSVRPKKKVYAEKTPNLSLIQSRPHVVYFNGSPTGHCLASVESGAPNHGVMVVGITDTANSDGRWWGWGVRVRECERVCACVRACVCAWRVCNIR